MQGSSRKENIKNQLAKLGHTLEKSLLSFLSWTTLFIDMLQKIVVVVHGVAVVRDVQHYDFN